ncbi:phytanoyl-CoA dioxygenase family protein [Cytobacillus firmus]|uniref:phytanoyl-CoA dioxygenase family protein n=1 Tax=Cytobacillus firmus TaxID=1399 RepID=UPI003002EE98
MEGVIEMKLTSDIIGDYRKKGHILINKMLPKEEVLNIRQLIRDEVYLTTRNLAEDQYSKTFLFDMNLWERNKAIKKFIFNRKLAEVAADLMGVKRVRILNDAAYFKKPNNLQTKWHFDLDFYPLNTSNVVTAWIPLINLPAEIGSMNFITKSHQIKYGDRSIKQIMKEVILNRYEEENYGSLNIGDITFHSGLTLHSAASNKTSTTREVITITYFEDESYITEPGDHETKNYYLNRFFPGLNPGDKAETYLNPILNH